MKALLGLDIASGKSYIVMGAQTHVSLTYVNLQERSIASSSSHIIKIISTQSIPNYKSFYFFDIKFDHSSYLKFCAKFQIFFCRVLVY